MTENTEAIVSLISERFRQLKEDNFASMKSEEAVKHAVILPVLNDLGWNIFGTREVEPEYGPGAGKVDYALLLHSRPHVFIEAKNISEELKSDHQEQLLKYAFQKGIDLAILTNGRIWEFYLPMEKGSWRERKAYSIDILNQEPAEAARQMVMMLARDRVASGLAEQYAQELRKAHLRQAAVIEALPKAWEKLLRDPNSPVVDYLGNESEIICGFRPDSEEIRSFLNNCERVIHNMPSPLSQGRISVQKKVPSKSYKTSASTAGKRSYGDRKQALTLESYSLFGDKNNETNWRAATVSIIGELYKRTRGLERRLISADNPTSVWFGTDERVMETQQPGCAPRNVPGTGVWVKTNREAKALMNLCYRILEFAGHSRKALNFSYRTLTPSRR